jgi:hypothetical protein
MEARSARQPVFHLLGVETQSAICLSPQDRRRVGALEASPFSEVMAIL